MKLIKRIAFLLLIPVVTSGQTVHVDEDRIVYKGTVKLEQVNKEDIYTRAKNALLNNVKGSKKEIAEDNKEKIAAKGSIRLSSPYHIIKTVEYIDPNDIGKVNVQTREWFDKWWTGWILVLEKQ